MANRVADCGVPQANPADIIATAVVTDIGVPIGNSLIAPTNNALAPLRVRPFRYPSTSETANTLGVGVPLSPVTGLITG